MAGDPGQGSKYDNKKGKPLTVAEERVVEYATDGKSNKDIADECHVDVRTIEKHFEGIFEKYDVHSRSEVISRYFKEVLAGENHLIDVLQKEIERLRRLLGDKDSS